MAAKHNFVLIFDKMTTDLLNNIGHGHFAPCSRAFIKLGSFIGFLKLSKITDYELTETVTALILILQHQFKVS